MEEESDNRSEGGRQYSGDMSPDITKIVQTELAKYLSQLNHSQLNQKDIGGGVTTELNMVQGNKEKLTPFEGHYAFTVIPSMVKSYWILDSGASSHVCYDADMMMRTYKLDNPVTVHLPDGSIKVVKYGGDTRVNKDIVLKDVLLVPCFTNNLI